MHQLTKGQAHLIHALLKEIAGHPNQYPQIQDLCGPDEFTEAVDAFDDIYHDIPHETPTWPEGMRPINSDEAASIDPFYVDHDTERPGTIYYKNPYLTLYDLRPDPATGNVKTSAEEYGTIILTAAGPIVILNAEMLPIHDTNKDFRMFAKADTAAAFKLTPKLTPETQKE